MNKDDKLEFLGQIIDIFEDNLTKREIKINNSKSIINLCKLDEDSKGVFFGGIEYDDISQKLNNLFENWNVTI